MARMRVNRKDDGSGAELEFLEGSGIEGRIDLTVDQLSQLITSLGAARAALLQKAPIPPIDGTSFAPVYRTNWALQIDALTEGSMLAFQHPAYGPIGLVLAPPDAELVIKGLQRHRGMIHSDRHSAQKPS